MAQVSDSYFKTQANNTQKAASSARSSADKSYSALQGYFSGGLGDPREDHSGYGLPLSRFGYYWKSYTDAYDKLYDGVEDYRGNVYNAFEDNEQYLDTGDIQNQWKDYFDRMSGYYGDSRTDAYDAITQYGNDALGYLGDARDDVKNYYERAWDAYTPALNAVNDNLDLWAGYGDEWVRPEVYHQWQDIASGGAGAVEDFWNQSEYNKYLTDLGLESFNRQANLGNATYNPYEVQDFIKNTNAQEMWTAFENLQEAGQMQPQLDYQAKAGMTDAGNMLANLYAQRAGLLPQEASLQANLYGQSANTAMQMGQQYNQLYQWYADAMNRGDVAATQQIVDLMNQQNQQMWQSNMNQQLTDAQLQYMLQAQMPAQKIMDFRKAKTASRDMKYLLMMQKAYGDNSWDWFTNATVPNALSQAQADTDAFNAMMTNQLIGAGISAAGSAIGGLGGAI